MSTTASGVAAHSEGESSQALGDNSHAEGGGSTASGYASHSEGNSTASGFLSHAEGNSTVASAEATHAEGTYARATQHSEHAAGAADAGTGGAFRCQYSRIPLTKKTTDATPVAALLGDNTEVTLGTEAVTFEFGVVGFDSAGGHSCHFIIVGGTRCNGATVTIVGSPTTQNWADAALSAATAVVSGTGTTLRLTVTGIAATTIQWAAIAKLTRSI